MLVFIFIDTMFAQLSDYYDQKIALVDIYDNMMTNIKIIPSENDQFFIKLNNNNMCFDKRTGNMSKCNPDAKNDIWSIVEENDNIYIKVKAENQETGSNSDYCMIAGFKIINCNGVSKYSKIFKINLMSQDDFEDDQDNSLENLFRNLNILNYSHPRSYLHNYLEDVPRHHGCFARDIYGHSQHHTEKGYSGHRIGYGDPHEYSNSMRHMADHEAASHHLAADTISNMFSGNPGIIERARENYIRKKIESDLLYPE